MSSVLREAVAKPSLLLLVALLQLLVVWANASRYRAEQNLQDQEAEIVLTAAEQVMRDHYEAYPYPSASGSTYESVRGASLADINHWLYSGAGHFGNVGIRILNAGGGTGQASDRRTLAVFASRCALRLCPAVPCGRCSDLTIVPYCPL